MLETVIKDHCRDVILSANIVAELVKGQQDNGVANGAGDYIAETILELELIKKGNDDDLTQVTYHATLLVQAISKANGIND